MNNSNSLKYEEIGSCLKMKKKFIDEVCKLVEIYGVFQLLSAMI